VKFKGAKVWILMLYPSFLTNKEFNGRDFLISTMKQVQLELPCKYFSQIIFQIRQSFSMLAIYF
jgi:hypothetical protein